MSHIIINVLHVNAYFLYLHVYQIAFYQYQALYIWHDTVE